MSKNELLSTTELRRQNKNRLYRYLYTAERPMTRQELAYALSMSLPTLTQNLRELMADGLVSSVGGGRLHRGSKPRIFSVAPGARFAVGGELTNSHIRFTAVDLLIRELGYKEVDRPFYNDALYARVVAEELETFLDENVTSPWTATW